MFYYQKCCEDERKLEQKRRGENLARLGRSIYHGNDERQIFYNNLSNEASFCGGAILRSVAGMLETNS